MNEPEKIYARVIAGHLYTSRTPKKLFGEEFPEYIRKDSLLEWAKEQEVDAKLATTDGIYYSGREHAFHELIEKLNSL